MLHDGMLRTMLLLRTGMLLACVLLLLLLARSVLPQELCQIEEQEQDKARSDYHEMLLRHLATRALKRSACYPSSSPLTLSLRGCSVPMQWLCVICMGMRFLHNEAL